MVLSLFLVSILTIIALFFVCLDLYKKNKRLRIKKHEFKNILSIIYMQAESNLYSDKKKLENIARYIRQEIDIRLIDISTDIDTGNTYLDAAISGLKKEYPDIQFITDIGARFKAPCLSDSEMFTILKNLIDNAVDSVNKESRNRKIILSSRTENDNLVIEIANYAPKADAAVIHKRLIGERKGRFTTKTRNKASHGFGLEIVSRTLAACGAKAAAAHDGSFLILSFFFPI